MEHTKTIVLAAGGTGGHIFPAESLATALIEQGHKAVLITDNRYKKRADTPETMTVKTIRAGSPGGGIESKLKAVIAIAIGFLQARKLLKSLQPQTVVGFGGYPSFPTMLAAKSLGLRMVIHEQNSVLGRVNRLVAKWADKIATSFEKITGIQEADRHKIVFTGNPVRDAIKALHNTPYPSPTDQKIRILVTGGSQGASIFSELIPEAILSLPNDLKNNITLYQQCRSEDIERVTDIYKEARIDAHLATFFDDIPQKLSETHLVIARSGASTVTELTMAGRPSILIPYIYATDDHQTQNAKALEEKNAAFLIHQEHATAQDIADKIKELLTNKNMLETMAKNASDLGVVDATQRLAEIVIQK